MIIKECTVDLSHFLTYSMMEERGYSKNKKFTQGYYIEDEEKKNRKYVAVFNLRAIKNAIVGIEDRTTQRQVEFLVYEGNGVEFHEEGKVSRETAFKKESNEIYPEEERPDFFDINENPDSYTKEQLLEIAIRTGFALMALEEKYGKTIINESRTTDTKQPVTSVTQRVDVAAKNTIKKDGYNDRKHFAQVLDEFIKENPDIIVTKNAPTGFEYFSETTSST